MDSSWYKEAKGGIVIRIKVTPKSSRPGIQGVNNNRLCIKLKSPPIEGKANQELVETLAKALKVPKREIEIIRGIKGREKEVFIPRLKRKDLEALI